ncbi:uncharacterized protein TRIVIDRAFT_39646 [Trichoderma virens Gv29-8]|uniref:Oxidoreductase n=1 Tax=Hypocrea virens (strain Gv29-8 / FGSC 10586) TaxID=413071 RepID=G9NBR9_HYPVG|nr:uncharacterized protein TRIVIDRAFT_39646 [Trichoderma virens Gv29-8]EHK16273.1 hypothetical protein TRIVIDRAFT_39646 [Trichoderma virens Gv29-8]UKZ55952.1 hypothetical protein TrVGV298_009776 [Trichoderma virens]
MTRQKEEEFQVGDMPNLSGYIAIVTGGNSGIGYETTLQLANHGARVYIASRSQTRVDAAIKTMKTGNNGLDIHFLKLDLQDLQSIKTTVEEFSRKETRLDILINNAGIMACPFELTKDGHELQWQTCFLGHHALTMCLLPLLHSAAQKSSSNDRVRIVNVSSDAAASMGLDSINYKDPNMADLRGVTAPWKRYGHSKQASIIAAKAITDRYRDKGITAYSLHPGIIKSNLQSHDTSFLGMLTRAAIRVMPTLSPADGARTSLYCATSPSASLFAGRYFIPFGKIGTKENKWLDDAKAVNGLWTLATNQLKDHGFVIEDIGGNVDG